MEATKKSGGHDPSGPQGQPSASSQQMRDGLRGSQGLWISSGSLDFQQRLSSFPEATTDEAGGPASQAHIPESIHQVNQDPAPLSSPCSQVQASQNAPRPSSASAFSSHSAGAQQHLVKDDGTLHLPVCRVRNSTSDMTQHGSCYSRLQVQLGREGKSPAKVLVGWGKGPCNTDYMAPVGTRKSRRLPYLPSGKDGAAQNQSLLASAQAAAQDQRQGNSPCPTQAPALGGTSPLTPAPPTPAEATNSALDPTPAVKPYNCTLDHPTGNTAVTKDLSQDVTLKRYGNQSSALSESANMVTSSPEKVNFYSNGKPPASVPTLKMFPDYAQEHKVAGRQVPSEQAENLAEKPLVCTSRPGTLKPDPEPQGTPNSPRNNQKICSSQPDKQLTNVCNSNCANAPPSAYQVSCQKQLPPQSPREPMQISPSSAPTCQLQEGVEDCVLVFDMATGNTRMGLLCHDPMGSRAVLVGFMPSHPSVYAPENILPTQPPSRPLLSPASNNSSFWSTTAVLSSPVPSSLSSGSYREVALLPKEARLNLQSQNSPGTETPTRAEILTGPVPLGRSLQFSEEVQAHAPDPSLPKPDAKENELDHTIWMMESSKIQTTELPCVSCASPANTQAVPTSLHQQDVRSNNQRDNMTAYTNNPPAEDAEQAPITGQAFYNGQNLLARQLPATEQGLLMGQPPSTRQTLLTSQPPFTRQTPFTRNPLIVKDTPFLSGPLTSQEPGQPSTQDGESLGLPTHVGVLQVPLTPQETCSYVNRDKVGIVSTQNPSMSQQPGSCLRAEEKQLSLITFATPGTVCKVLPITVVGTEHQSGGQVSPTGEDITHSSVIAQLGPLRGACYELVSTSEALSRQSSALCHHALGPYQGTAAVVIDTGMGFTKCGLAGEDHILTVVPSQVQRLQHPAQGQPQYAVPENQDGSYPVLNRGVVSDWDALEVLWQHLFYCKLGVQPEELAVLVADSPISPRTNREKVAEILFEHFHVPAMQTVHQALLALYAYGRTTGLVLGSGHGTSYVAPILTGQLAPSDTYRLDVAGADLTNYLAQLLQAGGHSALKTGLAHQIKEACCYVAMDLAAELAYIQAQNPVDFVLPDKQVITLGSERFCCPEALFQPSLVGLNQPGLPQLALLSISRLETKQQEQLLANVVLDGGSTLLRGFPERLKQELGPHACVLGSPHRAVAAWLGGSIMTRRDSFKSLWVSRHEYEEEGPWAIYKYQL
ncbi:PREDICTED: flocculation protein FLO11-like [Chinchilla lanigera]|uniref:Flocculation protein FLO11-like n=1 Tax=Chinchilla lanigera TaxID=34839 RepID=A0A8C2W8H6_CHILA|nr:PREDICTED: flocculation protein FLO11-like [Chinchilla lanigera]